MNQQRKLDQILKLMDRHLRAAKEDKYGVLKCQVTDLFCVRVTSAMVPRVLDLVERVAIAAGNQGYSIDHSGATGFLVNGVSICAFFSEAIHRLDHVPTTEETAKPWYNLIGPKRFDFVGSGNLKLEFAALAGRRTFADKAARPIENQIDDMMQALRDLAVRSKKKLEELEKRAAVARASSIVREDSRRAAEARRLAVAELEAQAVCWERACTLRAYILAIEETAENLPVSIKVRDWIQTARAHADSIDPLKRGLEALSV